MRSFRLLASALAIGASAVTAACGQQQGTGSGASASDPVPPASVPSTAPAGCRGVPAPPGRTLTLGNGDNGKTVCVTRGAGMLLILRGTAGRTWAPVRVTAGVLAPRANGRLALARWVTGAYFVALHPGTAVLSSRRAACRVPSPGARSSPASARCAAEQAFRVTIVVAGR